MVGISSNMASKAWKAGAKYLKVSPVTTRKVAGVPVTTNHITGTKVAKLPEGVKNIILGAGSKLAKLFGEGAQITSYPKGHLFGGDTGLITVMGKGGKSPLSFLPKEYGEFVKMMKMMQELAKAK